MYQAGSWFSQILNKNSNNSIYKCLPGIRHCSMCFNCIVFFEPHASVRQELFFFQFYPWGNWAQRRSVIGLRPRAGRGQRCQNWGSVAPESALITTRVGGLAWTRRGSRLRCKSLFQCRLYWNNPSPQNSDKSWTENHETAIYSNWNAPIQNLGGIWYKDEGKHTEIFTLLAAFSLET